MSLALSKVSPAGNKVVDGTAGKDSAEIVEAVISLAGVAVRLVELASTWGHFLVFGEETPGTWPVCIRDDLRPGTRVAFGLVFCLRVGAGSEGKLFLESSPLF